MGLGLLGRGVGDARWLAEAGAQVLVTDLKNEAELEASVAQLRDLPNVRFRLGEHRKEDFVDADYVLVGPNVPLNSIYVKTARNAGVKLKKSADWFAELSGVPVIGVTGTRGKSTVTHMIHHCLSVITGEEVLLGGNIRGVSNLALLDRVTDGSLAVMELDSWQLQGWGWSALSPQVAVFTNFMEDHLNYYQTDEMSKEEAMQRYFLDKAQIFLHQDESGIFVTTPEVFEWVKTLPDATMGQEVKLVDDSIIPEDALFAMPGEHNRLNAALAVTALESLGLGEEEIFSALATFGGVEGRLQLLKTIDHVRIYNDNNSTTPQATSAALEALDLGNRNIILIAGGADKRIPLEGLVAAIQAHCKSVLLLPGTGTDRLLPLLADQAEVVDSLDAAVRTAMEQSENADIVLFSPGFASFGSFANEYERNDQFLDLVAEL
jgi:UDP-N-acetylmuramoylalanine--D-glutamate ligase